MIADYKQPARMVVLLTVMSLWPHALNAQVELRSRAREITLTGRVHSQFKTLGSRRARATEFLIRRPRLTAEIRIGELVSGKIQPVFGDGEISSRTDTFVFCSAPLCKRL